LTLPRSDQKDFSVFAVVDSRWARLAGFEVTNEFPALCFMLPGETELGNAEEQPDKG
jgi:hypothetical protein